MSHFFSLRVGLPLYQVNRKELVELIVLVLVRDWLAPLHSLRGTCSYSPAGQEKKKKEWEGLGSYSAFKDMLQWPENSHWVPRNLTGSAISLFHQA